MSANAVVAPLAGSVFKILVNEGDEIEAGQVLLILEAMKMETRLLPRMRVLSPISALR